MVNNFGIKKRFISIIAIIAIIFSYVWTDNKVIHKHSKEIINNDVYSYYGYLPATFIHHDYTLSFVSDSISYIKRFWHVQAENGRPIFKTSMGMAVMYAPFFFVADAVAAPLGYYPNGYTHPYQVAILFSCLFYLTIGFVFLRKLLLKYFDDIIVAITLLIIGFATNLSFYATFEAGMPHSYCFALFCIFFYMIEKWYHKPSWGNSCAIGLLAGIISLIRPSNIVVVLVLVLFGIKNFNDIKIRLKLFAKNYAKILLMIALCVLVWLPQMLYWKSMTGHLFYFSYGDESFFFGNPHIFKVLFGFRKGWLIYTPSMVFSVIGLAVLWKTHRDFFVPILSFFIINLYIISSWWCWWYGGGFGMRALIESYAIMAFPLAAFLAWTWERKLKYKIPIYVCVAFLVFQSIFHKEQYTHRGINYHAMTKEAYFDTFWKRRGTDKTESLLKSPDYKAARQGKPEYENDK